MTGGGHPVPGALAPGAGRSVRNDYCQHFVDTGHRPQNFLRDSHLTDRCVHMGWGSWGGGCAAMGGSHGVAVGRCVWSGPWSCGKPLDLDGELMGWQGGHVCRCRTGVCRTGARAGAWGCG